MGYVLPEIVLPLVLTFAVGVLLGWVLWRWRRTKVSWTEWETSRSSLVQSEERLQVLSDESGTLYRRVDDLESQVAERDDRITLLDSELDLGSKRVVALESQVQAAEAELIGLRRQLSDALNRAGEFERDAKAARDDAASLQSSASDRELQLSGFAALREDYELASARIVDLETDLLSARDQVVEAEARPNAELVAARTRIEELEAQLSEVLDVSRARVDELEYEVNSLRSTSQPPITSIDLREDAPEDDATYDRKAVVDASGESEAEPDNLLMIDGVGPKLEQFLHRQGIHTFHDLAELDDVAIAALQAKLPEFPDRIRREQWVEQARRFADGEGLGMPAAHERDKLQRIKGVGPVLERWLHGQGIFRFQQLADLDDAAAAELDAKLEDFPGRIRREAWIEQSSTFVAEAASTS